jgi:hypothetical protein
MRFRNLVSSITLGLAVALLVALSLCASSTQAQSVVAPAAITLDHSQPISAALAYIRTQQQPDGGVDAFGLGASNQDGTARAVLALAAAGRAPEGMAHPSSGKTMLDYLAAHAITFTHDASGTLALNLFPSRAGQFIAAVAAANQDPTDFGSMNLVAQLNAAYHPATGAYSTTASQGWTSGKASEVNQAWAILGLSAAGLPVPAAASDYLVGLQAEDGSWVTGDPDTTALAVVALVGSGNVQPTHAAIQHALDFFRGTQLPSGGWRPWWDTDPLNVDSTAWVIQALVAVGYTPATKSWSQASDPHEALLSMQQADGSIGGTYVNAYSTVEALFGLTEQPLFFLGGDHRALRALSWMNELQSADGSWPGWSGPDTGGSIDAVLAFAAAGFDPDTVTASGSANSALDYLASDAFTYTRDVTGVILPAQIGKAILAVAASQANPRAFGTPPQEPGTVNLPINLVAELQATYHPVTGAYSTTAKKGWSNGAANTLNQAWAILGLAAAGETVPVEATAFLIGQQDNSGGWGDDFGVSPDTTALVLQSLLATGNVTPGHASVVDALAYLRTQQDDLGGWGNANSTAYTIQGLLAAGQDLIADWSRDGASPYEALVADQKIDGPFTSPWFGQSDNDFATRQAVPALLGVHYPCSPTALIPFSAVYRGPDPDRMVAAPARATWGHSVDVVIPFGSDQNGDGSVELVWRVAGGTAWMAAAAHRADGYFTATLPVTATVPHEFQVTFTDPDGVQYGSHISGTALLPPVTLEPYYVYLPFVIK